MPPLPRVVLLLLYAQMSSIKLSLFVLTGYNISVTPRNAAVLTDN